jgi:hypothetical protein
MNKLVISARYWNNEDWVEASLKHIDMWDADEVWVSEGNWDKNFQGKSTDKTRIIIEDFASSRPNFNVFDNCRFHNNYRENQALTSNTVMKRSHIESGDWMMIVDADHFYHKRDIEFIKNEIRYYGDQFDYYILNTFCFLRDINSYAKHYDTMGSKLPYKIVDTAKWIATNHLSVNNRMYVDISSLKGNKTSVHGYHYEGILSKERYDSKYSIGDRKTPKECGRLDNLVGFYGNHPALGVSVLRGKFGLI